MRARVNLILVLLLLASPLVGAVPASAHTSHKNKHKTTHRHKRSRKKHKVKIKAVATLASMGAEPEPSIFGIDTGLYDSSHANFLRDIPTAASLGARWDHFTAGPTTATGNWGPLDWEVKEARKYRMGVVLAVGGIASACSISPTPANIHACPPTTPADLTNYQAYFRKLVLRYRNVVQYYESWTEENNKSSWYPGPQPAKYAALLVAQYQVIQQINSQYGLHLQLLFGSPTDFSVTPQTSGWTAVLPFTQQVLEDLHGQRAFDGIALHAYRFPPGGYGPLTPAWDYVGGVPSGVLGPFPAEGCATSPWCQMTWPQELSAYEQEFANHGYGSEPMWLTEFGWPGNAEPNGSYYPSDAAQATDLAQAYTVLLGLPFVKGALWFNVRDYQPGYASPDPAFFYHYGLVNYNFTPKPAAAEFKALALANPGR
jgi:hypothetical protein